MSQPSLDQPIADAMNLVESLPPLTDEHGALLKENLRILVRQLRIGWLAYKEERIRQADPLKGREEDQAD